MEWRGTAWHLGMATHVGLKAGKSVLEDEFALGGAAEL
eukprot:CAMPEP_0119535044 /NCGR_PEP_ID=MMETSP1344-20130328/48160_1 /TAXON_ID=236787 /ORGANISM="Florenciella parvula, Strain CCMP2471" /LENGTH=37 /DNA_ID= /DNA_START= /DNA_END= /DNA_ORIENTATION=